jgi:hypothetical protein
MSWIKSHVAPDQEAITANAAKEPEGERIRAELVDWLRRNKIVNVLLNTAEHNVQVDIVKLPPEIKPVLTLWGSIYVRNEPDAPALPERAAMPEKPRCEMPCGDLMAPCKLPSSHIGSHSPYEPASNAVGEAPASKKEKKNA